MNRKRITRSPTTRIVAHREYDARSQTQLTVGPQPGDAWIVAPADLPNFSAPIIDQLIAYEGPPDVIVAARFGNRQGHPVLMPWCLADEVFRLPKDEGIRWLFQHHPVHYVDFPEHKRMVDVDTPEEYDSLRNRGKT